MGKEVFFRKCTDQPSTNKLIVGFLYMVTAWWTLLVLRPQYSEKVGCCRPGYIGWLGVLDIIRYISTSLLMRNYFNWFTIPCLRNDRKGHAWVHFFSQLSIKTVVDTKKMWSVCVKYIPWCIHKPKFHRRNYLCYWYTYIYIIISNKAALTKISFTYCDAFGHRYGGKTTFLHHVQAISIK